MKSLARIQNRGNDASGPATGESYQIGQFLSKDKQGVRLRRANRALVSTDTFVPVAPVAEFAPGTSKTVAVDGREIAVFNVDGTFYAVDNFCPHQGGTMADGWLEGTTITCPWHAWCFNLTDGSMPIGDFARLDPFDVRVENGQVLVSRTPRPD